MSFLKLCRAEGKSLFQQLVMMISHNLGDRLHIGQMSRHPQRGRRPTVTATHTEQIDWVSCRDTGENLWCVHGNTLHVSMKAEFKSRSCRFLVHFDTNLNKNDNVALWRLGMYTEALIWSHLLTSFTDALTSFDYFQSSYNSQWDETFSQVLLSQQKQPW